MRIHVLTGGAGQYRVVAHQATPAGNNSAGFAWSAVVIAAGLAQSELTVGTGPGQTTQAEMNAILAGTVLESGFTFTAPANLSAGQLATLLDEQAAVILASQLADLADRLKWYGATRT